jgi:antitoxin component of MazEF toxin-antitoxin module
MRARDADQRGRLNRWVSRLINRRLALWLISLAVSALLLGALLAVFWLARMKATYEVEAKVEGEGESIVVLIPREPLQKIVAGDEVEVDIGEGMTIPGSIRALSDRGEAVEAQIHLLLSEKPDFQFPPRVKITLRARRLLAAFRRGASAGKTGL